MINDPICGWSTRDVPLRCERLLGFSVPRDDRILVVGYDGTHLVRLGQEITVDLDERYCEYDIYDPKSGVARYQGHDYTIVGLHGGKPLLTSPQGDTLRHEPAADLLHVRRDAERQQTLRYQNSSGDWAAVTFSSDGRWIVLGCPYGIDFVLLERCP